MIELIKTYQLDIMLLICGACGILTFLLVFTRFLPKNRKRILILMEMMAFLLLWFDRCSYIYDGDSTPKGLIMLRLSNFMLFFLTSGIVFGFNLYLMDWLKTDGKVKSLSKRLTVTGILSAIGMLLAVHVKIRKKIQADRNRYHRNVYRGNSISKYLYDAESYRNKYVQHQRNINKPAEYCPVLSNDRILHYRTHDRYYICNKKPCPSVIHILFVKIIIQF